MLFKQPTSFWTLAFGEMWNTFSYYGTQTILVLYFMHVFQLSSTASYVFYGAYAAFAYSLPILGGIVADRWLGHMKAVIIGSGLNVVGNMLLMSSSHYLFSLGVGISLVGFGLYKSNATHLVGTLYQDRSMQKEAGFTLLYLSVNLGGVLGPLVYGLIVYALGWRFGFLCSAFGLLLAMTWFLLNRHAWLHLPARRLTNVAYFTLLIAVITICVLLSLAFYFVNMANIFVVPLLLISIIYLTSMIARYKNQERRRLIALLLLCFFGMFYFVVGLQMGSTITLFIQANIQSGALHSIFPASIFSTFYPLFVLLLAPLFSFLWHGLRARNIFIHVPAKLAIGIILAALGIGMFAVTALGHFVLGGILIGILLLSAGELTLMPAILTAISDLTPSGMKSSMMGGWLLFVALGGYLSSWLANVSHQVAVALPVHHSVYVGQFLGMACFTWVVAGVFCVFVPYLSRMMR